MRIILLSIFTIWLSTTRSVGQTVKPNSVVINKMFNSSAAAGDVVELLVLNDHVNLAGCFIRDQQGGNSASTDYTENGSSAGKYQFRDLPVWKNLRSGTTIVLRRNPSAYTLDEDASDYRLDISLDNPSYFSPVNTDVAPSFNIQNYDMIVLKAGQSAAGTDNLIHAMISAVNNNTKAAFDNFPTPRIGINALVPTTSGFLFANTPTAATAPHLALADFNGYVNTDKPVAVASGTSVVYTPGDPVIKTSFNSGTPSYGVGEPGSSATFISYLRNAPKIESITPTLVDGTSVEFTVLFNKAVTGVDKSDFNTMITDDADGVIESVTGSGDSYNVKVSNLAGSGSIRLAVNGSATEITDGENRIFEGFRYELGVAYVIGSTLPVTLNSYTANLKTSGGVEIIFSTASEKNSSHFTIERSLDGKLFSPLRKITSAGLSNTIRFYNLSDPAPGAGINYYRLIQYDINGSSYDLGTRYVDVSLKEKSSLVYPNPSLDAFKLALSGILPGEVKVEMVNMEGRRLFLKTFSWSGSDIVVSMDNLIPSGQYIIRVSSGNFNKRHTIVKL